jgi:hypothetical protein
VDFLGGSVPGQHGSKNWQQGCLDAYNPVAQEERMDDRFPQLAHQKLRRPYTTDQGSGNDQQGNEQLAILTRFVQVEFPKFDGNDPTGWIYNANKNFHVHRTTDFQKLLLVSIHMEGKASVWFQDRKMSGCLHNWNYLTQVLLEKFGPYGYDNPMEAQRESSLQKNSKGLLLHTWQCGSFTN